MPQLPEWSTSPNLACTEACNAESCHRRTSSPVGRYDARQCRKPEADLELSLSFPLQTELQRWSGLPASRECSRLPFPRQQTLSLTCGGSVESRPRVYLNHGRDPGHRPKVGLQTPPRRRNWSLPLCKDEPKQSPNRPEDDQQAYEHIVQRRVHLATSYEPPMRANLAIILRLSASWWKRMFVQ